MNRQKCGPSKTYSEDDLALFARYQPEREDARPRECSPDSVLCWVKQGPPAFSSNSRNRGGYHACIGCGGAPKGSL